MNEPAATPPSHPRPTSFWVAAAAFLLVLGPVVALEWEAERARWKAAAAAELTLEGRHAEAREAIDAALARDPGNPQLLLHRADLLITMAKQVRPWRQQGNAPAIDQAAARQLLEQAHRDLTEALEQMPNHSGLRGLRADVRLDLGDGKGAVEDWLAVAKSPDGISKPLMLNNLAYFRACAEEDLEQALQEADDAVGHLSEVNRLRIVALDTRGYIHHLLGNAEDAAEDLNQAVRLYREQVWDPWDLDTVKLTEFDLRLVETEDLRLREELAVLLYHRSLALAERDPETAEEDRQEIRSLLPGYDGRPLR